MIHFGAVDRPPCNQLILYFIVHYSIPFDHLIRRCFCDPMGQPVIHHPHRLKMFHHQGKIFKISPKSEEPGWRPVYRDHLLDFDSLTVRNAHDWIFRATFCAVYPERIIDKTMAAKSSSHQTSAERCAEPSSFGMLSYSVGRERHSR